MHILFITTTSDHQNFRNFKYNMKIQTKNVRNVNFHTLCLPVYSTLYATTQACKYLLPLSMTCIPATEHRRPSGIELHRPTTW